MLFLLMSVKGSGTGFQRGQQEVSSEYSQQGKEAKDIAICLFAGLV